MAAKSVEVVALAEIPQVTPFEAAQIRFAAFGPVRFQQIAGATEVAKFKDLLRRIHVGGVKAHLGQFSSLINAQCSDGRTDEDREQQQRCRGDEARQGGLSPAPTPRSFDTTHGSRMNRFATEETVEFVGQLLSALVAARRLLL